MSDYDFLDREAPAEHAKERGEVGYPQIQWQNGGIPGTDNPALANGCWELPEKYFGNLIGDAYPVVDVPHGIGYSTTDPAYVFPVLHLSVLTGLTVYYLDQGDKTRWSLKERFDDGYKSKTMLFAYVKELLEICPAQPVVISLSSTTAATWATTARSFRYQVLTTVDRLKRQRGRADITPTYAYWLIAGSNGRAVGESRSGVNYQYAPIVGFWDEKIASLQADEDLSPLRELAIPQGLYDHIVKGGGYEEAKDWYARTRENYYRLEQGLEPGRDIPDVHPSTGEDVTEDDIPF